MTFFVNKNLIFIYSMQFMNSTLEKLVKNLSHLYFKYLTERFDWRIWFRKVSALKTKGCLSISVHGHFERFCEEKLPGKRCFHRSLKGGTTGDKGEKLDGHVSDEKYLTYIKIWNKFNMKNLGNYHDHYLKEMFCY